MANNKLYNRSYFCKRLREAGIENDTLIVYDTAEVRMPDSPERRWTVVCRPASVLVTCYRKGEDFWFRLETADSWNTIVRTQSMKVMAGIISDCCSVKNLPQEASVSA